MIISFYIALHYWKMEGHLSSGMYIRVDKTGSLGPWQSYIYQVLQTIHMKLILLCVWAEPAVLGSAKTALKFLYKI